MPARSQISTSGPPSAAPAKPSRAHYGKGRQIARSLDLAELWAAYEQGASTVDLERRYGVSRATIRNKLRKAGYQLRDVHEASLVRPAASWLRLEKPTRLAHRKEVKDVFGVVWSATHETPTRHGFDVLRGVIDGNVASPSIILTSALADHLERHRSAPRNVDLPISGIAITRLRRDLGHDWHGDIEAWWLARRGDLETLSAEAFAERHGITAASVVRARRVYCGHKPTRHDWNDPALRAYLYSTTPIDEIASLLAVSVGHVRNLRRLLRDPKRCTTVIPSD